MFNEQLLGLRGDHLIIGMPKPMTGRQAVELAAWLVVMSVVLPGGGEEAFHAALSEVKRT